MTRFILCSKELDAIEGMTAEEAGNLLKAIAAFANSRSQRSINKINLSDKSKKIFASVCTAIHSEAKQQKLKQDRCKTNGSKGGRPKSVTKPKPKVTLTVLPPTPKPITTPIKEEAKQMPQPVAKTPTEELKSIFGDNGFRTWHESVLRSYKTLSMDDFHKLAKIFREDAAVRDWKNVGTSSCRSLFITWLNGKIKSTNSSKSIGKRQPFVPGCGLIRSD